jgi:hypothetical protein
MQRALRSLPFWCKGRGHEKIGRMNRGGLCARRVEVRYFRPILDLHATPHGGNDPPGRYRWRYPPVVASNQPGVIDCDG